MLSSTNHWGIKASKKRDQTFILGTSKWVAHEMNEANGMILQDSKYFSGLVQTELVWLNEMMLEVLNAKEEDDGALLLLRSPLKLMSKNSPVKKIRQGVLQELQNNVILNPVFTKEEPVVVPQKESYSKSLERIKLIRQVQQIIPSNKRLSIPQTLDTSNQQQQLPQNIVLPPPSEISLTTMNAEKLSPIGQLQNNDSITAQTQDIDQDKNDDFDSSFQAITKTIKLSNSLTAISSSDFKSKLKEPDLVETKLPLTTPNADKFSFTSFASLPSREPLTVKSTKKDRLSTKQAISSSETQIPVPKSELSSIYPPLSKLKPLPKHLFKDDKDENSPFKISTTKAVKEWVPPSPNKKLLLLTVKESPLNAIFTNAIKRARNLISPSKEKELDKDIDTEAKSVKRVVSSKGSRGNLMDRLTADTESSALRNVKRLDLKPTSRLYPDIDTDKRYSESPLAKKYNAEHKKDKPVPEKIHTSIPNLPVFVANPTTKSASSSELKQTIEVSPDSNIISKQELSKVTGATIASTAAEIRRKRLKAQESLTSLSLNKNTAPKRLSTNLQHRINKRMADERLRVEEFRKQRLSTSLRAISIDEQLKKPLHKMREKSMKAVEVLATDDKIDSKPVKRKTELLEQRKSVLTPLSEESMNKRRKTTEKGLDQKPARVNKPKVSTASTTPSSNAAASARTQTLMRTAMLQHARLNKPSLKPSETLKSARTTPVGKIPIAITPNSKSPLLLPEIFSEPEDDEEGHVLKEWAESPELKRLLFKQQNINPDTIFGAIAPLNMDDIFKLSRVAKFRARSSSAHWGKQDMLSHKEADEYRRKMGWKK